MHHLDQNIKYSELINDLIRDSIIHDLAILCHRKYMEFRVPKNESHFLAILPPGYELFIIDQQWLFRDPETIPIETDMMISVKK